jgi:DNA-binding GntR family transcriptional regulator
MATSTRTSRATTVDAVIEAITEGVKDGRYAPGQRLVEADLTQELGVSRGPLREALGRLASEGVIEIEPYRGAIVRRLTRVDLEDLFQVRQVLEGEAARLAATHIDDADNRARLEAALATADRLRAAGDLAGYIDENSRFHELIVEMSGSDLLARLIPQLQVHAFRLLFRQLLMDRSAMEQSIAEHETLAHAILAGDERGADKAMRRHVRRSGEQALRAGAPHLKSGIT